MHAIVLQHAPNFVHAAMSEPFPQFFGAKLTELLMLAEPPNYGKRSEAVRGEYLPTTSGTRRCSEGWAAERSFPTTNVRVLHLRLRHVAPD